ncbi:hypothetical protein QJS66_12365 [Kocuria rhizophila]|nr:hypothetical protein QJS66_12365 [Kocuria rhizophila]
MVIGLSAARRRTPPRTTTWPAISLGTGCTPPPWPPWCWVVLPPWAVWAGLPVQGSAGCGSWWPSPPARGAEPLLRAAHAVRLKVFTVSRCCSCAGARRWCHGVIVRDAARTP